MSRLCPESCLMYSNDTSCSCGQPGDGIYRSKFESRMERQMSSAGKVVVDAFYLETIERGVVAGAESIKLFQEYLKDEAYVDSRTLEKVADLALVAYQAENNVKAKQNGVAP